MKYLKLHIRTFAIFMLLLLGGAMNEAQAAKVTYHILTLPINPSEYDYHMKSAVTGHRLEAIKVVVDNQTTVELPAHYKSPLATGFTYYKPEDITIGGSAINLYDNGPIKGVLYDVKASPTPVAEGTAITESTAEYYVVYIYNASNTIAKLDGSVNYNIAVKGKGFLSLNRGRNNRPAVVPIAKVDPEMLASWDFSYVASPGNGITTFWQSGDNKNKQSDVESQFFFIFKFEGKDPYHIVLRTSYAKDNTYIEKNDGTSNFVYKWYIDGSLFAAGTANAYIASDEHKLYNKQYNLATYPTNPTNLTEGDGTGYIARNGNYHGQTNVVWGTLSLLNNTSNTGYVFMGTRTVDNNGSNPDPGKDNKYYYLKLTGNNLNFAQITAADATKDYTMDGIYPLKKVTFKVATPFYAAEQTPDHIVSVTDWVSQYTVENDPIETKYLPTSLRRKYCQYTGKFYSDAACTNEITRFSQATDDPTEGYQVYIGYNLTSDIPFKGITPAATYTVETWANATWYELTDEASMQVDGLKLKYDGTNFKNNGADNHYDKTTEFAFIGDPYELRVVYRNTTSGGTVYYVGAAGTPPPTGTPLTAVTSATEGYFWELPNDDTAGSFLLKKYKGEGNWYWNPGHPNPVAISYSTMEHTYNVATANAQTVTFNVSNLGYTEGDYILVTKDGTNPDQVTVSSEKFYVQSGGTASFIAAIQGRGDGDKSFTLSIQKYNSSDVAQGTASVITVNQNNDAIVANTVEYSTTNSTRVKVMTLPMRNFTYNIVDKSGRIAVKASATQTIFSPLSLASIPSIIVSPFLVGETVTFYSAYSGGGRGYLLSQITELTAGDAVSTTNVYVKYTTSALDAKPINLSEDQELNVKLNGYYIYYDKEADALKTNANPTADDLRKSEYLWKLRNRDPYAMLIDNMGAREDLSVADLSEYVMVYDDSGTETSDSRQKGAWLKLAASLGNAVGFTFVTDRANAQQFIAKSSLQSGVYEVMVADGGSASTTYYDIGCPEPNTVKIYNNSTYAHGHDVLRFVLNQNIDYTYHLIDKAKHELLTASSKTPDLALPAEYQSPLVATYHFYDKDNITESGGVYTVNPSAMELASLSGLLATATEPAASYATNYDNADAAHKHEDAVSTADITEKAKKLTVTGNHYFKIGDNYYVVNVTKACYYDIYVTYDVNDIVTFNTAQYMLKFLQPYADGYYLEDGNDKLTAGKIQAIYPYCNGDGNLNIYGNAMQKEQFNGGASTRPRWVWYFDSSTKDPYHVRIRSKSTINYTNGANSTYLTTYAVHFNQDTEHPQKQRIVTGGTLPGVASAMPMEYMVLGSKKNYKLLTTEPVAADLNGDGDTTDDGENVRRNVTSFEQYWKTYNMLKLHVLGIPKSTNTYSDDESTWVVPAGKRAELETKLDERGVGTGQWHSYNAYANATRWNGYNDKSDGEGKKVVENLEHWFQTFDMGNGTFDIESADIPPVLVLLDRHGWEIMRRPLPTIDTYPEGEELAGLRVYDSPLVDKYYFYSNATKASGCHKYTMRLQDGKERDQIKVNGERYSSTSLGDLPPKTATGVVSGGAIQDFYVIYTVKEEYENNYEYNLVYTEDKDANDKVTGYTVTSETGTSQPYLMLQNGRFYKTQNSASDKTSYFSKPISEHTNPEGGNVYDLIVNPKNHGGNNDNIIDGSGNFLGNNFWYVKPNLNIDEEMGITWGSEISGAEPLSKVATQVTYKDKSGFDPYNLQLQLVNKNDGTTDGRYLTTHMTSAHLDDGILVGDYTDGSKMITLETAGSAMVASGTSEGYDHTDMRITNQTFMAVSDANGNMQLMPRFDHTQRVDLEGVTPWETKLKDPVNHAKASADDNSSMGSQTTFLVCPQRFHYHIIDNNGREALRYKRGADFYPAITDHFKSPLAKDFTFYTGLAESEAPVESSVEEWEPATGQFKRTLTKASMLDDAVKLLPTSGTYYYRIGTRGVFTYKKVVVTKGLSEKEITGSFAAAKLDAVDSHVYVRYSYDEDADHDADKILQGPWFTVKLAEKDLQASGTLVTAAGEAQGTGVNLYSDADTPTKPATIDANAKKWQWKFMQAPTDPSSDYYLEPDPYAIQIFNREANHTTNPSLEPSPMAVGIKVPNANDGADRFALLSHPDGGYALVVARIYDNNYNYLFLNGENMTAPDAVTPQAATTATEANFNYKTGTLTTGVQVLVNDDVTHNYTYNVITNAGKLAITANQDNAEAAIHSYVPNLPESAQTPLLNMDDYLYYGFASRPSGDYSVIEQTKLYTLYGLYDDVVYVRYNAYDMDKTSFKVPNKRTTVDSHVARESSSVDVSMNLEGGLPYNIIWYNDNMMQSTDDVTVSDGGSHDLSGNKDFVWYFTENDPYALKIKHKGGKYLDGSTTMVADAADAKQFMLLKKAGYDYGILQVTGTTGVGAGKKLTGFGGALTADANTDPTKYIIFGLSIHNLIYHLVIAKTCPDKDAVPLPTDQYVDIPYKATQSDDLSTTRIYGTTQRDLESQVSGVDGDKYQLGSTLTWGNPATSHTYSYDAGSVSIGDEFVLPNIFYRPNCTFDFYIEGIYQHYAEANANEGMPHTGLEGKYKGLKLTKLMSDDQLIDQTVVVNVVYSFDNEVATNTGLGFVTSTNQNLWYTFETPEGETPYLAQYTNAWGLQAKEGRDTRYTNDYLWTPLGDVYGFKMYNRYMLKNTKDGTNKVMTMSSITEGQKLLLAEPGTGDYTEGNEIFELVSGDTEGYFRVHPVANNSGTRYYVRRKDTSGDVDGDGKDDLNYTILSTTPCDWAYGLDMALMEPYYERAGYVGGLKPEGKTAYETAVATGKVTEIQKVVYNDANIVAYSPGYYRLHSQPGVSSISPVRYASGYLHDIEKTAVSGGIPMHFYSKEGILSSFAGEGGLSSGFTVTNATQGDIPIAPTEKDPSTIFYFEGNTTQDGNPRSTMQTQGLYVAANANGDAANGTTTSKLQRAVMKETANPAVDAITFSLMDIGGAVLLIHDGAAPATRCYLNYDQSNAANIYDLKYYHESPTDDARWCMQPVQKTSTAGDGEMPLEIATNNGGDGYYYATFYAPFDVSLPADADGKTYNAYVCKTWDDAGLNPVAVPAATINTVNYAEGKFVPANTPVIIRVKDESGTLTLLLPTASPSSAESCVFIGSYLEQKLTPANPVRDVYTLGVPFTSDVQKDVDYTATGDIIAPLPEFATSGVGFYINATYDKESDPLQSLWNRNNLYVLHNKIYYRASASPVRETTRGVEFVPVIFDDDEDDPEQNGVTEQRVSDGCVYDLLGRKVASEKEVRDGTWQQHVGPGFYIIHGKKIMR